MREASQARQQRLQQRVLEQVEDWLETPMFVLGLVWLVLLIVELTHGLSPLLERLSTAIWVLFIVDFATKFILSPQRLTYVRKNWLTVIALLLPALRVFRLARVIRVLRFGRATRSLQLVRLVTSFNRGLKSLRHTLGRYGFGYVLALTIVVTFLGAAGMFAFERDQPQGLNSYGDALWFTAMLMTTSGSEYWPRSPEGRTLCFLLALYAFAVFGYVTATLASFLLGSSQQPVDAHGEAHDPASLKAEIAALRGDVQRLVQASSLQRQVGSKPEAVRSRPK
jgi:voltage-gated potassium channel